MGSGQIHVIGFVGAVSIISSHHCISFYLVNQGSIPENLISRIITKGITLRGILIGSVSQYVDPSDMQLNVPADHCNSRFKGLLSLMEANPTTTQPVVDKIFSFEESIDAFAYLESQKHVGKVVIKVSA